MADGVETVAGLRDPVGQVIDESRRPNGLVLRRVRVPIGVIGIIYESRPNVTADAAALCLKSGNAVILRGGSEAIESNRAIHAALVAGLEQGGLPADAVQLVPITDRAAVGAMLDRGGRDRPDRAARRQGPGRPRPGRGARARARASRRDQPCLCPRRGRSGDGGGDRRQRQDAPHRRVRRDGDVADRPRLSRSGAARGGARRVGLRGARRRGRPCARSAACAGRCRGLGHRISRSDRLGRDGRRRRRRDRAYRRAWLAPYRRDRHRPTRPPPSVSLPASTARS